MVKYAQPFQSLSAWRAWIEIANALFFDKSASSLSAWRAWIEISQGIQDLKLQSVALRLESVD